MVSHRMLGRKFGRKSKHRIAMGRNILKSLIEHGRIVTTLPKAKEYRPRCEKVITLGRVKTLHNIRLAAQSLNNDKALVKKLFDEIGPRFKDRPGGYLRIRKLSRPRLNDNAPRAILEFVDYVPPAALPAATEVETAAKA
jgi:large subunit ribosomal protein L17